MELFPNKWFTEEPVGNLAALNLRDWTPNLLSMFRGPDKRPKFREILRTVMVFGRLNHQWHD
jgi:hypothetical protein